jgi:diguanylate cyclase (GGDEF)-like protein
VVKLTWLCPTPLDRERVLETNARLRRPRLLALFFVAAACVVASPWLGWVPIVTTLVSIAVGAVATAGVRGSGRPEYRVLAMIAASSALMGVAAAASGGPQSPLLALSAVILTGAAAYFRERGVRVASALVIAAVLGGSLIPDPGRLVAHPSLPIVTIAIVGSLAVYTRVGVLAELDHRRRSIVDPLTGALNRNALGSRLDELAAQAAATGQPVCAIACDLDRFKRVNDLYGHARGDRVLADAVGAMRSALRGFDSLYRIGGEEFVILLPRATVRQGAEVAERLRAAVELARPGGLDVTASFGVAASSTDPVGKADKALYAAKRRGRNRVVTAGAGYAAA